MILCYHYGYKEVITIFSFGDRLKKLRLDAGMTQEELAGKCGMKKQSISRYENSDREPNIRIAKSLADALGVSIDALVLPQFNLQFFAQSGERRLTPRQQELIGLLDQLPPEQQDSVIDRLEDIVRLLLSRDPR